MTMKIKNKPDKKQIRVHLIMFRAALLVAAEEKYSSLPEEERKKGSPNEIINHWINTAAQKMTIKPPNNA